jgi:hypothetical protein
MHWNKPDNVRGFDGADVLFVTDNWFLARWNHSKCRGWQLYRARLHWTKWIIGAGIDSLAWTEEKAQAWAEDQINLAEGR